MLYEFVSRAVRQESRKKLIHPGREIHPILATSTLWSIWSSLHMVIPFVGLVNQNLSKLPDQTVPRTTWATRWGKLGRSEFQRYGKSSSLIFWDLLSVRCGQVGTILGYVALWPSRYSTVPPEILVSFWVASDFKTLEPWAPNFFLLSLDTSFPWWGFRFQLPPIWWSSQGKPPVHLGYNCPTPAMKLFFQHKSKFWRFLLAWD